MKWQGLRQSANFIDLRNVTSVELVWQSADTKTDFSKVDLLITTAGTIFDRSGKSTTEKLTINNSVVIIIVNYQAGITPNVTSAQKNVLTDILKKVGSAGREVSIKANAGQLQELATAIYRNIQG